MPKVKQEGLGSGLGLTLKNRCRACCCLTEWDRCGRVPI